MANTSNQVYCLVTRRGYHPSKAIRSATSIIEVRGGSKGKGKVYTSLVCLNTSADYRAKAEELLAFMRERHGVERWQVRNMGPFRMAGEIGRNLTQWGVAAKEEVSHGSF